MTAEERKEKVKQALANERLEGLKVSKFAKKVSDDYIAGKVSAKEASRQIRQRYGA